MVAWVVKDECCLPVNKPMRGSRQNIYFSPRIEVLFPLRKLDYDFQQLLNLFIGEFYSTRKQVVLRLRSLQAARLYLPNAVALSQQE